MSTVLKLPGFRVVIYPNDHRPAHVHVIGKNGTAVFVLNCPKGPPEVREVHNLPWHTVNKIADDLDAELKTLCEKWSEIHGRFGPRILPSD